MSRPDKEVKTSVKNEEDQLLTFTRFVSASPLSKKVSLVDGKIVKSANAQLSTGTAERVRVTMEGFAAAMEEAGPNVAFGYGTFGELYGDKVGLLPRKKGVKQGFVNRTKDYFAFPQGAGIMMLDNDYVSQGMLMGPDRMLAILRDELGLSGIGDCPYLHRESASSGVSIAGDEARRGKGFHLYLAVKDATDIPRAGDALFKRLWLLDKGYGFINLSLSGALLVRGIIDNAVFSQERLDFVGRPMIEGGGLVYTPPVSVVRSGGALFDTREIRSLTDKEEKRYLSLVDTAKRDKMPDARKALRIWSGPIVARKVAAGMDEKAARRQVEAIGKGEAMELPSDWVLHFTDKGLGTVTVAEVLRDEASMKRFDRQSLADPIEGVEYGESTAIFYANLKGIDEESGVIGAGADYARMEGRPFIHSFAHGKTCYWPQTVEQTAESGAGKPVIVIAGGRLPENVDAAEEALMEAGAGVYQQGGRLVRPVRSVKKDGKGVVVPDGSVYLEGCDKVWIREAMTKAAQWLSHDGRSARAGRGDMVVKDCPSSVAETYCARVGEWKVPPMSGLSACPTIDLDTGRLITENGYDKDTGIFVDYSGPAVEMVKGHGMERVAECVRILMEPIAQFPFVKTLSCGRMCDFDRSVALSAMLTAVARKSLGAAPLHAFDATVRGSGKSMLASVVSIIATGTPPPMINTGHTDEELEKRVVTLLMMGLPVVCLDNVSRPLGGDILNSALTESSVQARVLGKSENKMIQSSCMVMTTGNNLRFVGDLARRTVRCKLDPEMEKPEERVFQIKDLRRWAGANRGRLLGAALSLLDEFCKQGKPRPEGMGTLGSFESWNENIRGCLVWAGLDDPYGNHDEIDHTDPVLSSLSDLLHSWDNLFSEGARLTPGNILKAANGNLGGVTGKDGTPLLKGNPSDTDIEAFREAVMAVTNRPKGIDTVSARTVNDRFFPHQRRVVDGIRLESTVSMESKQRFWFLTKI